MPELDVPAVVEALNFQCPFCGRGAFAIPEPQGVGHEAPACPSFNLLNPADYLAAVNRANLRLS